MKISIVVPVYNAEKYLDRCLKSVVASLKEFDDRGEIVVVDNGSTDGSMAVVQEWDKKIAREKTLALRVIECQTPGAAAAKNVGMRVARGEYVWFVDADDEVAEGAVGKLLAATNGGEAVQTETETAAQTKTVTKTEMKQNQADLVMMGVERVYADGRRDYLSAVLPGRADTVSRFVRYGMGPWQVIVRRKWWQEHELAFPEGMIHEDMALMSVLILLAKRYAAVDEPLYFYHQTPDSVLHRRSWDEHAYDIFPALEGLLARFKALGAEKRYRDELEWFFIWNLLIDSAKDFAAFPEGRAGFTRSREMLSKYFPRWRKNRFLREKPLRLRLSVTRNYYRNK